MKRLRCCPALGLGLALAACAGRGAAPPRPEPGPVATIADAAPPALGIVAPPDAGSSAPPPASAPAPICRRLALAPSATFCAKWPRPDAVLTDEQTAWFAARGAKPPAHDVAEVACWPLQVGPANEDALVCDETTHVTRGKSGSPTYTFRVLFRRRIYAVRDTKVVTVFDEPLVFDALDTLDVEDDPGPLFGLDAAFEAHQGSSFELAEPRAGACTEAKRALEDMKKTDKSAGTRAWAQLDRELVTRLCSAVGRYVWQGRRYIREREPASSGASSF